MNLVYLNVPFESSCSQTNASKQTNKFERDKQLKTGEHTYWLLLSDFFFFFFLQSHFSDIHFNYFCPVNIEQILKIKLPNNASEVQRFRGLALRTEWNFQGKKCISTGFVA